MAHFIEILVLVLTTCCCLGCKGPESRLIQPEIQSRIDDFVTNVYFPISKTSKLGLAIVKNNSEIVYSTGYGMADEKKGIPNGNQTQFLIASITKSFTATVIVKLLHEHFPEMGEAVLDTPVMKLMTSAINVTFNDRYRSEHFTFRDLLAHRMCIPRHDLPIGGEPFSETSELVYRQRYAETSCGMRTQFEYNNQMYVIAGELAGILANTSYTQLVNDLLWEIGMYNSSLASKSDDFSTMPFRAQPYYVLSGTSYPMNPDLIKRTVTQNAAGGLFVPPNDMIKYMNLRLNKGNVDGKQIIPQEVMSWLTKPSIHLPELSYKSSEEDPFVTAVGYGLGMELGSYDGWEYNSHNGYLSPYSSVMSLFPSQNLGIFTSTNEGKEYLGSKAVHLFVFEILRGTSKEDAIKKLGKFWMKEEGTGMVGQLFQDEIVKMNLLKHRSEPIPKNEDIIGKYGSGALGDVEILMKLNPKTNQPGLYVEYGKWGRGWMENVGGSIYKILWDTDIVQEYYARGVSKGFGFAGVENRTVQFYSPGVDKFESMGKFTLGVSLDTLPTIPWDKNSC